MKMFGDYYDPIEEYEMGVKLLHTDDYYEERYNYERGIKPFNGYDEDIEDGYEPCIRHFGD